MADAATPLGAVHLADGRTAFTVWAPLHDRVDLHVVHPYDKTVALEPGQAGYFRTVLDEAPPGTRYRYRLGGGPEHADPASRSQPEGVGGPSEVVDARAFPWTATGRTPPSLDAYVIYELHVGTFTREGTFDAVIPVLDELAGLGVTAIELMPVAQFPGHRNWGYDGVFPYAAQDTYGGPAGLLRLVDACHARGLAVVLDVVYNHVGPEGSVHREFGPYFTDRYRTPWGEAVNVDGPGSDDVRRYFLENAQWWLRDCRIDALRLDAVHAIVDTSPVTFLEDLSGLGDALGAVLIAESDANDPRLVRPREAGGLGMHAQWCDDVHHAVHALLSGERDGYYADYGSPEVLARALSDGFVYQGERSAFRRRRHGRRPDAPRTDVFVVCGSNHDQVGNRASGDRPSTLLDHEKLKLAAGLVLLSPFVPLLFMGEEYGETAPFPYFVSHADPGLVEAVRRGRREEFAGFAWQGDVPDPADPATFEAAKLDRTLASGGRHRQLLDLYRELLRLRARGMGCVDRADLGVDMLGPRGPIVVRRPGSSVVYNVCDEPHPALGGNVVLDASDVRFGGPGADGTLRPWSFHVIEDA